MGVFQGEPHIHYNHWDNFQKRSSLCSETEDCQACATGDKKKFRFRLNMIVKADTGDHLVAKVLEGGWKLYNSLGELNNEFPLEQSYIKIKRTGKTMHDTVYTVLPSKAQLTEVTMASMKRVELLPLDPKDPFWNQGKEASGFHQEEEAVPF